MKRRLPLVFLALPTLAALLSSHATHANAPAGRYIIPVNSNGTTVFDTKTQLTWQRLVSTTTYPWGTATTAGTAQATCAALKLSNLTGWRLPTESELLTLVDHTQAYTGTNALIDSIFENTPAAYFWSATPVAGTSGASALAWCVDFSLGHGTEFAQTNPVNIRCVHD
jgi:hypothetical protein